MYAINNIFVYYNLAIENYNFIWVFLIALIIEVAGIFAFHSSLLDVIKIVFACNLLITLCFLVFNKKEIGINLKGDDRGEVE